MDFIYYVTLLEIVWFYLLQSIYNLYTVDPVTKTPSGRVYRGVSGTKDHKCRSTPTERNLYPTWIPERRLLTLILYTVFTTLQ